MMKSKIKSCIAFKNISSSNFELIESDSELVEYDIGYPICNKKTIPDKILFLIEGEARLLHHKKMSTIEKLKPGSFIGLSSFLRANGCEYSSASSKIIAMAIPDKLILKLYKEEDSFRNWCNSNIFTSEIHPIAFELYEKIPHKYKDLKEIIKKLESNVTIKSFTNGDKLDIDKELIYITGSSNFIDKEVGDFISFNDKLEIRGDLNGRVLIFPKSIFNSLSDVNKSFQKDIKSIEIKNNISKETINKITQSLNKSTIDLGQDFESKKFKLIKGEGPLRESLAVLQMISNIFELPFRVDSIEKILRNSLSRGQTFNLQLIGGITSMMGLYTTTVKVNNNLASRLPSNSIISWKNSFAIVKESNEKKLELISPTEGNISFKPEEFETIFDERLIEMLILERHDQTPNKKFGVEWLLPAINRYRGILLQVLLASFIVQLFGLASPLMIQVIIDKVINQRSLDTLQILGVALVVITILGGVISSLRTFLFQETTNRIDTRLGAEVIDHLLRLPLNYFDKRPVGELGSRISELEKIRNFLTGQALTTILDAAFSLIYIVVMAVYSWLLTFIALGVVPIQILITLIGTPLIRRQIRETAQENAKTQSHLVEVLTGIQTVKAQNVERVSRWKWQELYNKYISTSFKKTITGTALQETSQVLQQLSQLLVLWIGASLVLAGKLSLGQLIAFRIISGYVTQPLLRLSTIWQNIQELRVSFERLADIVDTPEEADELDKSKIPLPSLEGEVEYENVSFSFQQGQPEVLKSINLKIKKGQFVGVVGQSGSGKSTLMKLLPRLYKPTDGRLLIDGYDVNKVELFSLRRQIGIVPQEPLLFAGSVNDNIALIDPESPSDEIVKVARIADAHDFIMELPDGYSTSVGERGSGLSGGQKQRIAIARTLLSNPKLLILDEATSALDYETERKVCEGLRKSCQDSTVFFITHRLSTVRNADLIVMLDKGNVVEIGTHDELINQKGRYYALFLQQESS